ncbi:hypothetical protein PENSPDRAFT_715386 [Peniophora sp. CONT]|nr:hypothetical protein PENSPDRAFT_715386 [Peniophora sp. CONT]
MTRNNYNTHSRPPDPEDLSPAELDELALDPEAALDDSLADEPAEHAFAHTPTPVSWPPAPPSVVPPALYQAFQHARAAARPSAPTPTAQMRREQDHLAQQLAQQHVQPPQRGTPANLGQWERQRARDEVRAALDGPALAPDGQEAHAVFNEVDEWFPIYVLDLLNDDFARKVEQQPARSHPAPSAPVPPASVPRGASPSGPVINNRSRAYASVDLGTLVRLIHEASPFSMPPSQTAARWEEIAAYLHRSVNSVRKKTLELFAWHKDNGSSKAVAVERCLRSSERATLPALLEGILHDRAEAKALTDEQKGQRKQKIDHERRQAELLRQEATGTRGRGSASSRLRDADDDQEARLSGKGKAPEDPSPDTLKRALPDTPTRQQHKRRKIDDTDTDPFIDLVRQGQAAQERQTESLAQAQRIAAETASRQVQITADLLPTLGQIAQSVALSLERLAPPPPASDELPSAEQPSSASGSGSSPISVDEDDVVMDDDFDEDVAMDEEGEE